MSKVRNATKPGCFNFNCNCQDHLISKLKYHQACLAKNERICRVCKDIKPFEDFSKNKSSKLGITCTCKKCASAASIKSFKKFGVSSDKWELWKKRSGDFKKLKSKALNNIKVQTGCQKCGYKTCGAALEFHHIDPTDKKYSVAEKVRSLGYDELFKEIAKCILVCANCHKEIETMNINISNIKNVIITKQQFLEELENLKSNSAPNSI